MGPDEEQNSFAYGAAKPEEILSGSVPHDKVFDSVRTVCLGGGRRRAAVVVVMQAVPRLTRPGGWGVLHSVVYR